MNIGIICTWPWGVKNAESEVILRMKSACDNLGIGLYCITSDGFLVDEKFQRTKQKIDETILDFIIAMHYEDQKLLNVFTYLAMWNPPQITLQYPEYYVYASNMITCDDFLFYNKKEMLTQLKSLLDYKDVDFSTASSLTASFSEKNILEPKLENPELFYCGTNWEVFTSKHQRHEGLFRLLDTQDWINIYGPNRKKKHPWKGYKRYIGEIPFDGFSVLNEINKCGVCLVLSSAMHWEGHAVSSRIYEATCAGAVVISDDNEFIKEHFGDSVLYIDFAPKYPEKMYKQICEHMDWIRSHKSEALELARKSQQIFREKFVLEKQIKDIINNHEPRKSFAANLTNAHKKDSKITSVYYADDLYFDENSFKKLRNVLDNNQRQIDIDNTLYIISDLRHVDIIENEIKDFTNVALIKAEIFDKNDNKILTRGKLLREVLSEYKSDYFYVNYGNEIMYNNYFSMLVRTIEDNPDCIASYGNRFYENKYKRRTYNIEFYENIAYYLLHERNKINCMIKSEIFNYFDLYILDSFDYYESSALLMYAIYNKNKKIILNRRCLYGVYTQTIVDIYDFEPKISLKMQLRYLQGLLGDSIYLSEIRNIIEKRCKMKIKRIRQLQLKIKKYKFILKYLFGLGQTEKYNKKLIQRTNALELLEWS